MKYGSTAERFATAASIENLSLRPTGPDIKLEPQFGVMSVEDRRNLLAELNAAIEPVKQKWADKFARLAREQLARDA